MFSSEVMPLRLNCMEKSTCWAALTATLVIDQSKATIPISTNGQCSDGTCTISEVEFRLSLLMVFSLRLADLRDDNV
jgi:hypothetical protein